MQEFTIAQRPMQPDQQASSSWYVEINGTLHREYLSQWAAIVDAFVAAHEATHGGDEATVVVETSSRQIWTFSLMPGIAKRDFGTIAASVPELEFTRQQTGSPAR